MKNRFFNLMLVALVAVIFGSVGVLTAEDCADVPEEIMIDNKDGYERARQVPVELTHTKHVEDYGASCEDCHHVYEDGKNVWEEGDPVHKCSECHDHNEDQGNAKKLQTAFHSNCKDCHKEAFDEGNKNAPVRKCTECHKR
ncbi:MAG: cytochrome c3 family protein [Thermodesulfobacteriota bacterium]